MKERGEERERKKIMENIVGRKSRRGKRDKRIEKVLRFSSSIKEAIVGSFHDGKQAEKGASGVSVAGDSYLFSCYKLHVL